MSDVTTEVFQARPAKAVLRISFDQGAEISPEQVFKALEAALRPTGCPKCGLGGIDIILRRDVVLPVRPEIKSLIRGEPDPVPWSAILEGGLAGQR